MVQTPSQDSEVHIYFQRINHHIYYVHSNANISSSKKSITSFKNSFPNLLHILRIHQQHIHNFTNQQFYSLLIC